MADSEDNDLREKNNEMVKAIQHWKMTAAQKENEKLELMKEVNEWRLKFSRLKNAELAHAKKLNADLQTASEGALSHLVQASSFVARMLELTKTYMQGRQEIESVLPRWSSLSNTPTNEKVNRVPPLLIGGRHIQPVVSLSRTWQPSDSRTMLNRSLPQNNGNVSARAVPMHMLQDVFIPLTRIDAELPLSNVEVNVEDNDSTEDSTSDESSDRTDEPPPGRLDEDDSEESQRLEAVPEEMESEDETPQRPIENPLEGPSWLLDVPTRNTKRTSKNLTKSEPDSTTQLQDNAPSPGSSRSQLQVERPLSVTVACEFTPTVRRRRRASPPRVLTPRNTARAAQSPHFSPRPARRNSNSGRILKVMVAKMRLSDDEDDDSDASPPKRPNLAETPPNMSEQRPNHTEIPHKRPNVGETQPKPQKIFQRRSPESPKSRESSSTKRPSNDVSPILCPVRETTPSQRLMRFDAPSPNGSTDACVIVLETRNDQPEPCCSGISQTGRLSRANSRETQPKRSNHAPSNSNHDNHPNSNHNHTTQQHSNHDNRRTKTRENLPNHGHNNHSDNSDNNHDTHPNSRDNRRTKTKDNQPNHASNNHSDNSDNNHDTLPNSRDKHGNHDIRRTKTKDNLSNNNSDSDNNHDNHRDNHSNGNHSSCDHHNHTSNITNSNHDTCNFVSDNHNKRSNRRRLNSHNDNESDSSNSDAIGERARRPRKAVVYKEKPLNRKLRR